MVSIIKEAPEGFAASVELMNTLKQESLAELCDEVIQFLQYKIGAVNKEKWSRNIQQTNKSIDAGQVQSIINSIIYLYRSAASNKLSSEEFSSQVSSSMVFTPPTQSTLCNTWSQQGKLLISSGLSQHTLGVGQLIDIQWKVGVAMTSDSCKSLNSPFVTLTLTVADPAGHMTTHNLELTTIQFRNFTNQLKDIAKVLETV